MKFLPIFIFTDHGAWFGYALPGQQHPELVGSFSGPFLLTHNNGCWASPVLSQLELLDPKLSATALERLPEIPTDEQESQNVAPVGTRPLRAALRLRSN